MSIDDSKRYGLLDRLAEEFAARFRSGERPSLKDYVDRYPELADEIRELFPALIQVEQVEEIFQDRDGPERAKPPTPPLSQVGDYRIIREIGRGGMGIVYEAEQISLGRRVALKVLGWRVAKDRTSLERFRREARASARMHHTNIVPVFEVGQDGEVYYYAMQFIQGQGLDAVIDELRRLRSRSPRERGHRPAQTDPGAPEGSAADSRGTAARSGVAQSLLTGRFEPGPAVGSAALAPPDAASASVPAGPVLRCAPDASAMMPGGTQLSTVESRQRAFHRGVAHIGRQTALALAHAHARSIIHRDVKPSNLLLDTEGVVWVTDFGLAKVNDDDDDLTRTGDVLGTVRYMAPERFRGQGDARADLYSLGLTLYELLVLRPAYDAPDRIALSEQIKTNDPPRPRSIDPRIPRDLETIVLKAIEKDPRARYSSAEALADDLGRFLDDQPILARRVATPERFARWARRNPVIATLGGVLAAVLVGATIVSVVVAGRMAGLAKVNERAAELEREAKLSAQQALAQTEANRREADRQRDRAERHLYIARIGQAESSLRLLDSATARSLLDQCRPEPGGADHRGWEWFYLDQWCRPELRTLVLPTTAESQAVAVSPDGRLLAVGCSYPLPERAEKPRSTPTYVISLPDGKVLHELAGHAGWVFSVAFRPDGKRLATVGDDKTVRIWDAESGRELRLIKVDTMSQRVAELRGLSWSPDGGQLAGAVGDGVVRFWDPATGQEIAQIAHAALSVAWSPDGTRVASGGDSGLEVRRWEASARRWSGPSLRRPGAVRSLVWSADSRRLAAVSVDNHNGTRKDGLTVWDATSGETTLRVEHVAALRSVAFSATGTRLATGGKEGIVRVFDAASGTELATLFTGCMNVSGLAFSPDGRRLFATGWGMGGIKVFDPDREPRGQRVRPWREQLAALTFDREGLRVVGAGWQAGELISADPVSGTVKIDRTLPVSDTPRWPRGDFAFSADARRLAAPLRGDQAVVGVWDVAIGEPPALLKGLDGSVTAVAFRPDGQALATAAAGGPTGRPVVTLWHRESGRAIRKFESGPDPVQALAFSRDGRKLAAGGGKPGASGWVTVWDTETRGVIGALDRVGLVMFLAFHPDGARLAVADYGGMKVHLWDLTAGTLITNPGPVAVSCVAFTPDGNRLAALGYDGNVHLCDAGTGDEVLVLRGFGPPIGSFGYTPLLAVSPDGSQIAGHYAGMLNIWDLGHRSGPRTTPEPADPFTP